MGHDDVPLRGTCVAAYGVLWYNKGGGLQKLSPVKGWLGLEHLVYEEMLGELVWFCLWKKRLRGELTCLQLAGGSVWRRWTFILGVCRNRMRGSIQKLQQGKFQLDTTKKKIS